ncbi:MAG TPA: class I SAM-dependent methyltransferase [Gaiellaceae bacterium]|jgi:ubiquinone/menaquinone biosynthesis C-methylase UbiE|nr:class I SAM-dependent methyltransferase [Gaiellaceae bacterium]
MRLPFATSRRSPAADTTPSRRKNRWDEHATRDLERLAADRDRFVLSRSPHAHKVFHDDLMARLGSLPERAILEIGCGRGKFSVFVAKQGAVVKAVDISEKSIEAARLVAEVNDVECTFVHASATALPFDDDRFDRVVGIAVLHHLPQPSDVANTLREAHRVLRPDGRALFVEPIENSRIFDFIQNLIPRGGGDRGDYRPSILQRRAWAQYRRESDERRLTERELVDAGSIFGTVAIVGHYGLLARLWRILGRRWRTRLETLDAVLLRTIPPLRYLARDVLVEYRMNLEGETDRVPATLADELHDRVAGRRKLGEVEADVEGEGLGISGRP